MAVPAPNTVSADIINTELGKSAGSNLQWNFANTRNLAVQTSGTIDAANLSYGIALPAESNTSYNGAGGQIIGGYALDLVVDSIKLGTGANATVRIDLYANGVGWYREFDNGSTLGKVNKTFTWLPSGGTAGNHYINFQRESGDTRTSGDSINTDLILSTDRNWQFTVVQGIPGSTFLDSQGRLILKYSTDAGATKTPYFEREYYISVFAERQDF
jgi:hypothetical protein